MSTPTSQGLRKASPGLYRIVGEDGWDWSSYLVVELATPAEAITFAKQKSAEIPQAHAAYGPTYFVYDDQGRCLARINPPTKEPS